MSDNLRADSGKNWAILKEKLIQHTKAGPGSVQTEIDSFQLHRQVSNDDPKPHFYQPVIIVVAQGKKRVRIGGREHHFGDNLCFVSGVDMPVESCVMEASLDRPYLSMSLKLNPALIAALASQVPPQTSLSGAGLSPGAIVQALEPDLLDAFLRLLELLDKPQQVPVMGELLLREIHYRLLCGPFGGLLRSLNTFGSQSNQIARAVAWLKDNYKAPLLVEELAALMNMAPSTFHKHFKGVTALSPLQYQKRLRLGEAQRLMLDGDCDVTQAAFAVGYESATQFIREYKRLFGEPPRKNIVGLKTRAIDDEGRPAA